MPMACTRNGSFQPRLRVVKGRLPRWAPRGMRSEPVRCSCGKPENFGDVVWGNQRKNPPWKHKIQHLAIIGVSAAAALSFTGVLGGGAALAQEYQAGSADVFDAMSYVGRWYEIASLKQGFAGEGQQDCHCTQGVYQPRKVKDGIGLTVNTFCFHGGPTGSISGIQGSVTCADPYDLKLLPEFESKFEREENIVEKCVLKFPSIPFIPPEPYDVIETDYKTYALVQGAADTSFFQIYSRTPNPGGDFLKTCLNKLKQRGYPVDLVRKTPQDCPDIPTETLMQSMTKGSNMEMMMTNTMPNPMKGDNIEVEFAGPRNIFSEVVDFLKLSQQDYNGD